MFWDACNTYWPVFPLTPWRLFLIFVPILVLISHSPEVLDENFHIPAGNSGCQVVLAIDCCLVFLHLFHKGFFLVAFIFKTYYAENEEFFCYFDKEGVPA